MNLIDRYPPEFPPRWCSAYGDDLFGLWAEFDLVSAVESDKNLTAASPLNLGFVDDASDVVQRMRWIEPGTFLMGSPEDEPGRQAQDCPRHPVSLRHGFWLADTACTQKLWRGVTGCNPSRFDSDNELPVEQVSWIDVHLFLRRLETQVPGLTATLPTEAQWEYACRAGTTTPFYFGENISPELANYDGNLPYRNPRQEGKRGLFRRSTIPVKTMAPNAWGLYQMHGNVWEWCADGKRPYSWRSQIDPEFDPGPGDDAEFAVRGGSWSTQAKYLRSAKRTSNPRRGSNDLLGFRFALRP
jgi:formylglycine-generating enzyme required for sulfatase activity